MRAADPVRTMEPVTSRVERYLAHLDALAGGAEPQFWPLESAERALGRVVAIAYRNLPKAGLLTGLTYGLSLASHPDWVVGRPELSICVRSQDPSWALAAAFVANRLRGRSAFSYGELIDFGEPVSPESAMDGFVAFAPLVLDREAATVDVGDDLPVRIVGLYPVHASERAFVAAHGLEAFWRLDWDPYDVTRAPAA